jgi:DNA-binding transcriptional ArsR family regulator
VKVLMGEPGTSPNDTGRSALAAAMAHPLRFRILVAVTERSEVSIRQIAARVDEPGRRVRHQLDALKREGLVAVTRRKNRRGGIEYLYSATEPLTLFGNEGPAVTIEQERGAALQILRHVLADATAAVRAGTFGRTSGHNEVRDWGEVDRAGWEEIAAIQLRAYEEIRAAFVVADERVKASGEPRKPVISAMFLFESTGWESEDGPPDGPSTPDAD